MVVCKLVPLCKRVVPGEHRGHAMLGKGTHLAKFGRNRRKNGFPSRRDANRVTTPGMTMRGI